MNKILLVILFIFCLIGYANATNYYLDDTGCSDNYNGTAVETPWCTFDKANIAMSAGDTLNVRGGTYNNVWDMTWTKTGTAELPITIKAYTGETPVITGNRYPQAINFYVGHQANKVSYITFDGFEFTGAQIAFDLKQVSYLTFKNCNFHNMPTNQSGVIKNTDVVGTSTSYITIENNTFTTIGYDDVGDHAIYFGSYTDNVIVRNNWFKSITGSAFQIYHGPGTQTAEIYNNIIRDVRAGMFIYDGASGVKIYNNTIYNWSEDGIAIGGGTSVCPVDITIKNNILFSTADSALMIEDDCVGVTNLVTDYNIYYSGSPNICWNFNGSSCTNSWTLAQYVANTTNEDNGLSVDPHFNNEVYDDFTLRSDSQAIDTGTPLAIVTTDYAGTLRPQNGIYDRGAYENFYSGNTATTFSITNPALAGETVTQGDIIEFNYQLVDPDTPEPDGLNTNLYYTPNVNDCGAGKTLLTGANCSTLNLPPAYICYALTASIPVGTYYVCGISCGDNQDSQNCIFDYAPGQFIVETPPVIYRTLYGITASGIEFK